MAEYEYIDTDIKKLIPVSKDIIELLQARFAKMQRDIEFLSERNTELKDQLAKDKEVQKLNLELDEFKKNYYRGFPISEEEHLVIDAWRQNHDCIAPVFKDAIGIGLEYTFMPTSIGTVGTCTCPVCNQSLTFRDLD